MRNRAVLLLIPTLLLIHCGKKGDLYLEPEILPMKITDLQIRQVGDTLALEWKFPKNLSDKTTAMDLKKVNKIRVYYSDQLHPPKKFLRKATTVKKAEFGDLTRRGGKFRIDIRKKTRELRDADHYAAIAYRYLKKKSPLSNISSIHTAIPITPISDLSLAKETKVIKLKWSRPRTSVSGKPVRRISGYRIYRMVQKGGFKPINKDAVLQEYFEDPDTSIDGTYHYRVSALTSRLIESGPSNTVSVNVSDIFPPDPPANLVSFRAEESIFLTWNEVRDTDFSHYRLYRKLRNGEEFTLLTDGLKQNFFRDESVQKRVVYIYTVTAVDRKGNESSPSNEVSESID